MRKRKEYANACDILPPSLLKKVQKHFQGLMWVPADKRKRVKTACDKERNRRICSMRDNGMLFKDIAKEVGLCPERIRQIVKQFKKRK